MFLESSDGGGYPSRHTTLRRWVIEQLQYSNTGWYGGRAGGAVGAAEGLDVADITSQEEEGEEDIEEVGGDVRPTGGPSPCASTQYEHTAAPYPSL